jgi:hypothetical protein
VESGVSVSMSLPLSTHKRGDNPVPADHRMTMLPSDGSGSVRFAKDYVGGDFHNDGHSHLDALCPDDVLLVCTGHARRLDELGPWDTTVSKTGLHPTAATFLAERQVAAMGSDGNNDTIPSAIEGLPYPIHVLAINAMGVHLLDYLGFEDLAAIASAPRAGRSCSSPRRCGSPGGPGRRSTRSRSSDLAGQLSRRATRSRCSSTQSTPPAGSLARNESIASDSSSGEYSEKVE